MNLFKSFVKGSGLFLMVGGFCGMILKTIQQQGEIHIFIGIMFSLIGLMMYVLSDALGGLSE